MCIPFTFSGRRPIYKTRAPHHHRFVGFDYIDWQTCDEQHGRKRWTCDGAAKYPVQKKSKYVCTKISKDWNFRHISNNNEEHTSTSISERMGVLAKRAPASFSKSIAQILPIEHFLTSILI